jgi:hypothetical protein
MPATGMEVPMSKSDMTPDIMERQWVCMACNSKFRFGQTRIAACSERLPYGVGCPNCGNGRWVHPADGEVIVLDEYYGELGTVQ